MATNEILPFSQDIAANVLTQAEYLADSQRPIGNQPGIARSKLTNKALRQVSAVAAAVAEYIANRQATNITDALTASQLSALMMTAINQQNVAAVTGTADAIVLGFTPAVTTLQSGITIWKAAAASTSTTPTVRRDALAVKTLVKGANQPLLPGDVALNMLMLSYYDASIDREVLLNPAFGIRDSSVKPGTIFAFAGTTPPTGALLCPTSATTVSRTTYAALFAAIGTTWGVGDGSTTFGIPWFPANYVPAQASANVGTSYAGENISHAHTGGVTTNVGLTSGAESYFVAISSGISTGSTGGAANLAAQVRTLFCVQY